MASDTADPEHDPVAAFNFKENDIKPKIILSAVLIIIVGCWDLGLKWHYGRTSAWMFGQSLVGVKVRQHRLAPWRVEWCFSDSSGYQDDHTICYWQLIPGVWKTEWKDDHLYFCTMDNIGDLCKKLAEQPSPQPIVVKLLCDPPIDTPNAIVQTGTSGHSTIQAGTRLWGIPGLGPNGNLEFSMQPRHVKIHPSVDGSHCQADFPILEEDERNGFKGDVWMDTAKAD